MTISELEYYKVQEDGEQTPADEFGNEEDLVYIIVDHTDRMVFLWKGIKAPVRLKFIGSRAMGDRRKEVGFHYKIDVNDGGDETKSFKRSLGWEDVSLDPNAGLENTMPSYSEAAAAQGIEISDEDIQVKTSQPGVPSAISSMGGITSRPQKSFLAAMDEDGEIDEPIKDMPKAKRKATLKSIAKEQKKEAQDLLSELGSPKGYEREMVVVGNAVFRSKGDDQVVFEDLDNPLDGLFMVESYTPRLVCENGRIIAIELLKRTSEEIGEEDLQMNQDLEDLTAMFQIEIDE